MTVNYLLQLANRAYELFESSEMEQKRQLLKLIPQNLTLEGRIVRYDAIKPFDTILNFADNKLWLPLVDMFRNKEIELGYSLEMLTVLIQPFQNQLSLHS